MSIRKDGRSTGGPVIAFRLGTGEPEQAALKAIKKEAKAAKRSPSAHAKAIILEIYAKRIVAPA